MKTEQEQAQAMAELIINKDLLDDKGRPAGKLVFGADQLAVALVNAGYGDVSEYKAEIERLRQEVRDTDKMARNSIEQYKDNYDNAFERLKAQEREIQSLREANIDLKEELYELHDELDIARAKKDKTIKQTQIDLLNKAKEKLDSAPNGWAYTGYIDDLIEEIEK